MKKEKCFICDQTEFPKGMRGTVRICEYHAGVASHVDLSVKPSLTCLEEANKENELLYKYLSNKVDESNHYEKLWVGACVMLSHTKLRIFFYVLAVALIAFTGGIWFTWQEMGQPKIDRNLQESGLRIYQCNGTFYPCAIAE